MDVIIAQPPNLKDIQKAFPAIVGKKGIVYTYGNLIFNPDGGEIDEPLQFHEATHSLQQDGLGVERWWHCYLTDPGFRLQQEIEAYQNQYRRYCELVKDRNRRAVFLNRIAVDLSSSQYGNIIDLHSARQRISNYLS